MHRGTEIEELESVIAKLKDDIKVLEESLDIALKERDDAMAEAGSAMSLRDTLADNCGMMCTKAMNAYNERDAARRELCMVIAGKCGKSAFSSSDAVMIAIERGWDCFRENP